jgi:hypothetical protein
LTIPFPATDFNFNVEEWDAAGQTYETLAICRTLALARAVFAAVIAEKPAGGFMIRRRIRVAPRGRLVRFRYKGCPGLRAFAARDPLTIARDVRTTPRDVRRGTSPTAKNKIDCRPREESGRGGTSSTAPGLRVEQLQRA